MHIETFKYLVKEGFSNIWKNSLMSLASICIILVCLLIFGSFGLVIININHIINQIEEQQQIQVFLDRNISEERKNEIKLDIEKNKYIKDCLLETKDEALEKFKMRLGEDKGEILDGFKEDNPLRDSYIITLNDLSQTEKIVEQLNSIEGVVNVKNAASLIQKLRKTSNLINLINYVSIIVLGVIAVFIIANTIRLTVFSRRKEINIMKFVGATDLFIKLPFIIEGMIIGLIGGVLSIFVIYYGYSYFITIMYENISFFSFKEISDILYILTVVFCIFGIAIGAIGSSVAVKKHLRV